METVVEDLTEGRLSRLKVLHISEYIYEGTPDTTITLFSELAKCSHLHTLSIDLRSYHEEDEGADCWDRFAANEDNKGSEDDIANDDNDDGAGVDEGNDAMEDYEEDGYSEDEVEEEEEEEEPYDTKMRAFGTEVAGNRVRGGEYIETYPSTYIFKLLHKVINRAISIHIISLSCSTKFYVEL